MASIFLDRLPPLWNTLTIHLQKKRNPKKGGVKFPIRPNQFKKKGGDGKDKNNAETVNSES